MTFAPSRAGILQCKCACGQHTGGSACADCSKKKQDAAQSGSGTLQRRTAGIDSPAHVANTAPPIVHDVLRSPGQPLDTATRSFFEPRFGYDLSGVRVHTDAHAMESAAAVNALAYTVGNDIAFGAHRYAPGSIEGRKLLAHELTHVVQQTEVAVYQSRHSEFAAEREAERNSAQTASGSAFTREAQARAGSMQKAPDSKLDEKAKKIIEAAKDTSKSIDQRAIDAVNSIVKAYFDPALVEKVVYDEKDPGLTTSPIGAGKEIKGQITVGKYFIEQIDAFARRVLQVGHELQHVDQQRSGMGGQAKRNEREFLAFHWEATQPEKAGTGKMPHATRVSLIDEALRNYYCVPDAQQKSHSDKKDELLKLRETEEKASGKEHVEPPKECKQK